MILPGTILDKAFTKGCILFSALMVFGCGLSPGRLTSLDKAKIPYLDHDTTIMLGGAKHQNQRVSVQYTGCGGLYIVKDGDGILIDPFFSNPRIGRLAGSMLKGKNGKRKIRSDKKMIEEGWMALQRDNNADLRGQVCAIFSAHSHYDHLMDVPAVFHKLNKVPPVFVNESGYYICRNVIAPDKLNVLEKHMTTGEVSRAPIALSSFSGQKIVVYPILADHNPHFKNIKFFSGSTTRPLPYFSDPYGTTKANDWLEGHTFSFLIDYLEPDGSIGLRIFIQSSSCHPSSGVPPRALLDREVDIAFLGVASYSFSPDYPCTLLQTINAKSVVWIHWEDFFRSYNKKPKTVRGTDVVKFFDLPCVKAYRDRATMPWPKMWLKMIY